MARGPSNLRLGVRGLIRSGANPGTQVLVDSIGPTPTDPLIVIASPDLNVPGHPDELVLGFWPAEIGELIESWDVAWTDIKDDQAIERFI